jgi:hypothetical protein
MSLVIPTNQCPVLSRLSLAPTGKPVFRSSALHDSATLAEWPEMLYPHLAQPPTPFPISFSG